MGSEFLEPTMAGLMLRYVLEKVHKPSVNPMSKQQSCQFAKEIHSAPLWLTIRFLEIHALEWISTSKSRTLEAQKIHAKERKMGTMLTQMVINQLTSPAQMVRIMS